MQNIKQEDIDYKTQFFAVSNISAELLPENFDFKRAYKAFSWNHGLEIQNQELLLLFSNNPMPKEIWKTLKNLKDSNDCNLAHYAAWAGNVEILNKIKRRESRIYTKNNLLPNNDIEFLAHFAIGSNHPETIAWIEKNWDYLADRLIDREKYHQVNTAELVIGAGSADGLDWLKNNCPSLLLKLGEGNLLQSAALSKSAKMLERTMLLSKNPAEFHIHPDLATEKREIVHTTLISYLTTSYTLTKVNNTPSNNHQVNTLYHKEHENITLIDALLERNKAIETAILKLRCFKAAKTSCTLIEDIHINIFKQLLALNFTPSKPYFLHKINQKTNVVYKQHGIVEDKSWVKRLGKANILNDNFCLDIYKCFSPMNWAIAVLQKEIRRLFLDQDINKYTGPTIAAIDDLIVRLQTTKSTNDSLNSWKNEHQDMLKPEEKKENHKFFKPNIIPCIESVEKILSNSSEL